MQKFLTFCLLLSVTVLAQAPPAVKPDPAKAETPKIEAPKEYPLTDKEWTEFDLHLKAANERATEGAFINNLLADNDKVFREVKSLIPARQDAALLVAGRQRVLTLSLQKAWNEANERGRKEIDTFFTNLRKRTGCTTGEAINIAKKALLCPEKPDLKP